MQGLITIAIALWGQMFGISNRNGFVKMHASLHESGVVNGTTDQTLTKLLHTYIFFGHVIHNANASSLWFMNGDHNNKIPLVMIVLYWAPIRKKIYIYFFISISYFQMKTMYMMLYIVRYLPLKPFGLCFYFTLNITKILICSTSFPNSHLYPPLF